MRWDCRMDCVSGCVTLTTGPRVRADFRSQARGSRNPTSTWLPSTLPLAEHCQVPRSDGHRTDEAAEAVEVIGPDAWGDGTGFEKGGDSSLIRHGSARGLWAILVTARSRPVSRPRPIGPPAAPLATPRRAAPHVRKSPARGAIAQVRSLHTRSGCAAVPESEDTSVCNFPRLFTCA
jgi:hypothetical protein